MTRGLLTLLCFLCYADAWGGDMPVTPFRTNNQSPLVQIFGLPTEQGAALAPPGRFSIAITQDLASNYTTHATGREQLVLDGEASRWTVAARYGVSPQFEAGVEIPYLIQGGGFLDSFIIDWHRFFGLPQGGRDDAPRGRIGYSYSRDGVQRLSMNRSGSGLGDLRLTGALSLHEVVDARQADRIALRASLKLPTGDTASLRGSGSTDLAVTLCASMENYTEWGTLGVYGALGGVAMTTGRVLGDQQNHLAGTGMVGVGWGVSDSVSFKLQLNGTTPLYRNSSLPELADPALLLVVGGALRLPGDYRLDLGVAEDVAVATAPDVTFHVGLSKSF